MAVKKVIGMRGRFQNTGPVTYTVGLANAAGDVLTGGTSGNAGKTVPAGLNASPLGVATTQGVPAGTAQTGVDAFGRPNFTADIPAGEVAVARKGAYYLKAGGTIAFLDFVKAGAAASVVKWDPATDQANPQLGQCIDTDGATIGLPVLIDVNIQG